MQSWKQTASEEDINLVLEIGYPAYLRLQNELSSRAPVVTTSAQIGKMGEEEVFNILKKQYPSTTNTAKSNHVADMYFMSGDININNKKFIVEVKNYKSAVQSREVDKFLSDVETSNCAGGIFVSLHSPIATIESGKVDYVGVKQIPVIYLSGNVSPDMIISATRIIMFISLKTSADVNYDKLAGCRGELKLIKKLLCDHAKNFSSDIISICDKFNSIAGEIESMMNEAEVVCHNNSALIYKLEENDYYKKLSAQTKKHLGAIISKLSKNQNWKFTAKTLTHVDTNICLKFVAAKNMSATFTNVAENKLWELWKQPDTMICGNEITFLNIDNVDIILDLIK